MYTARWFTLCAAACWCICSPVRAEVLDSAAAGFTIEQVRTVQADPQEAWRAFVEDLGKWWNPAHTYTLDSSALSIDPVPGGCFCEALSPGGVEHMRVVMAWPGRLLRMRGGLGPLQALGVAGAFTVSFEPAGDGTSTARLRYQVGGYTPEGLAGWAAPVDGVLGGHMDRYQAWLAERAPD